MSIKQNQKRRKIKKKKGIMNDEISYQYLCKHYYKIVNDCLKIDTQALPLHVNIT